MLKAVALSLIAICATAAIASEDAKPSSTVGFPHLQMGHFSHLFNKETKAAGSRERLWRQTCSYDGGGQACTYRFSSVSMNVTSNRDRSDVQGAIVICGVDCDPYDVAIAVMASLRVLAPGLSAQEYGSWVKGLADAMERKERFETTVGHVRVGSPRVGALGLLVFLTAATDPR